MDSQETEIGEKKPSRWKKVGKIIGWIAGICFLLFAVAVVSAHFLERTIKQRIINEVNERVTEPIQVKGAIDLSLIRHFPYASLTFRRVVVADRLHQGKNMLEVKEFSFLCNLYSLFGKEIEFTRVILKDGELNMFCDERGQNNYDIFKPAPKAAGEQAAIRLKRAIIKNVQFRFVDKRQATDIRLSVKAASLRGNFTERQFALQIQGKFFAELLAAGNQEYLRHKKIVADVELLIDKAKQRYSFTKGKIDIERSAFAITGHFALLKNATEIDFTLKNSGKDMQELFALLPDNFRRSFSEADGSGEYDITARVKGQIGKNIFPGVKVEADVKNSELKLSRYNKFLKKVNATAVYELNERGEDQLIIRNFNCMLNGEPFNFSLTLTNLSNPAFNFYANGVLQLSELSAFVSDSVMQDLGGKITFRDFRLTGRKADFTDTEHSTLSGSGEFVMDGIEFRQNGITYGNINGKLTYDRQTITAQNFTLNFLSTDLNFTGTIDNLFAFAYNLSKKRTAGDVVLGVNGKLSTQTFNLNGILEAYDKKNRPAAQQRQKVNIRDVFQMKGNLDIAIHSFLIKEMQFRQLTANLQIAPDNIRINSLQADAMGGQIKAGGTVAFTPENTLKLNLEASAVQMDIPQIFRECGNFGQSTLTDKNLRGTVSTAFTLNAAWKNYKELDKEHLSALVDFSIKNGELLQFEPLRAASKFIRLEELADIRFSDLSNTIQIANQRIDIPEFEIKSSALNLILYGHHGFDNIVDYHFKINLHKLLAQKFNRRQSDVQYVEHDPYEGLNLYLTMTGPLAHPKIRLDKPAVRNKIRDDFKRQKEELRNLIYGKEAVPESPQEKKREEKYFDVKEQPQFMDFEDSSQ